ncbi:MAG: caspase family protein [Bacteroidota bacterium]
MKNKLSNFLLLFLFLLNSFILKSQSFFTYSWEEQGKLYKGLLVYYDPDEAYIRVREGNNLVQSTCYFRPFNDTYSILLCDSTPNRGKTNQKILYGTHLAIHLDILFNYKSNTRYKIIEKNTVKTDIVKLSDWEELDYSSITKDFLNLFFIEGEDVEYYEYLRLNILKSPPTSQDGTKMHFILVVDTEDLQKQKMRDACKKDKESLLWNFQNFCTVAGIEFMPKILEGGNFNKTSLIITLNDLNTKPNDVIVFFYSGHGFRFNNTLSDFPLLKLHYLDKTVDTNSIGLTNVYDMISLKNCRLKLVFADCCNDLLDDDNQAFIFNLQTALGTTRKTESLSTINLGKLFKEQAGSLLATACSSNEMAGSTPSDGGFFINSIIESILNEAVMKNTNPSWESIIKAASKSAKSKRDNFPNSEGTQNAIFKIKIN